MISYFPSNSYSSYISVALNLLISDITCTVTDNVTVSISVSVYISVADTGTGAGEKYIIGSSTGSCDCGDAGSETDNATKTVSVGGNINSSDINVFAGACSSTEVVNFGIHYKFITE